MAQPEVTSLSITQDSTPAGGTDPLASTLLTAKIKPPTVTSVSATTSNGGSNLNAGQVVTITLSFSGPVIVAGDPSLQLNDGAVATYSGSPGADMLTFSYLVADGENAADLKITGVNLPSGASITDPTGVAAHLKGAVTALSLVVDTTAPNVTETLADDTGWSATDQVTSDAALQGTGDAYATVTITDESGAVLGATQANAKGAWSFDPIGLADGQHTLTATETDAAGNVGSAPLTFLLDTTSPTDTGASSSPAAEPLQLGTVITVTLSLTEAVELVGGKGSATITLQQGSHTWTAKFADGNGTDQLTFQYTAHHSWQDPTQAKVVNLNYTGTNTFEDAAGNTLQFEQLTICFMAGTLILTPEGARPVESLAGGDLVLTAAGEAQPVIWIGRQTVSQVFADPLRVLPIRIAAGALDENLPQRDLLVSPDHALLVDDILVQAGALVNGTTIRREQNVPAIFTYYHVELAGHALILAEGVAAETFVDHVDRMAFDNWEEHPAGSQAAPCIAEMPLPRAKSHRQVPGPTRDRLAARAAAILARTLEIEVGGDGTGRLVSAVAEAA